MNRIAASPRANWQAKVEEVGLTFHTIDGQAYWDESAYYQLNAGEVNVIEAAANELHLRCIDAAQYVIDQHPRKADRCLEDVGHGPNGAFGRNEHQH